MEIAVVVATFGDRRWSELAHRRAVPSALLEQPDELILHHGGASIAEARNAAASRTSTSWLCFLDADDELEPGYLAAMRALEVDRGLLAPAIREVVDGIPGEVRTLADRDIRRVNPCVIGTLIRRDVFEAVGRFWPERAWEDWSLFRRAWLLLGENVVHVPEAVYRIHVDPAGRNSTVDRPQQLHREIIRSHAIAKRRPR